MYMIYSQLAWNRNHKIYIYIYNRIYVYICMYVFFSDEGFPMSWVSMLKWSNVLDDLGYPMSRNLRI